MDTASRALTRITELLGSLGAVATAVAVVVVWALCGPVFGFSEAWQLVINTTTTIVTSLMVFIVQHTQNRDGRAIQTKLDLLLRLGVENLDTRDLDSTEESLRAEVCRVVGIEDLPERDIRREQTQVRDGVEH